MHIEQCHPQLPKLAPTCVSGLLLPLLMRDRADPYGLLHKE